MACVLTPMERSTSDEDGGRRPSGRRHPVRIGSTWTIPRAPAQIEAFAEGGFKGIKMHTPKHELGRLRLLSPLPEAAGPRADRPLPHRHRFHVGRRGAATTRLVDGAHAARVPPHHRARVSGSHDPGRAPRQPVVRRGGRGGALERNLYFDLTGSSLIKKAEESRRLQGVPVVGGADRAQLADAVYAFEKLVFGTDEPPEQLDNMLGALRGHAARPAACPRRVAGRSTARRWRACSASPVRP